MEAGEREQDVAQQRSAAQSWPRDRALVCACLGAVALQGLSPPVEAQRDAAGYVGDEGQCDDEGLGEGGLVVRPCEQEVAVCFGDGAGGERDERGVCDVEGGEDAEGVGRVLLDARYCRVSVLIPSEICEEGGLTPPHRPMAASQS